MGARVQQRKYQPRSDRFNNISFANGVRIHKSVISNLPIGGCRMSTGMCAALGTKTELDPCSNRHTPIDFPTAVVPRIFNSTASVPFRKGYLASNR